jgi:hypothetical protein
MVNGRNSRGRFRLQISRIPYRHPAPDFSGIMEQLPPDERNEQWDDRPDLLGLGYVDSDELSVGD